MCSHDSLKPPLQIEILGAESLGVRGLCCSVITGNRRVLIDPGVALGYLRHGLHPHPFQVAVGAVIRKRIISAFTEATDIVISHFHGDHVPLADANPYQLSLNAVADKLSKVRLWGPDPSGLDRHMRERREAIINAGKTTMVVAEGMNEGPFRFSHAMPHGEYGNGLGTVMMTRIEGNGTVFVHASDIQLLEREPVQQILDWEPDIVLVGGPPLYLPQLSRKARKIAWENALRLEERVPTLILDHHQLRSREGINWLDRLNDKSGNFVGCAADFMKVPRRFLEAWRKQLYRELPVSQNWHEEYARHKVDTAGYQRWRGWDVSSALTGGESRQ